MELGVRRLTTFDQISKNWTCSALHPPGIPVFYTRILNEKLPFIKYYQNIEIVSITFFAVNRYCWIDFNYHSIYNKINTTQGTMVYTTVNNAGGVYLLYARCIGTPFSTALHCTALRCTETQNLPLFFFLLFFYPTYCLHPSIISLFINSRNSSPHPSILSPSLVIAQTRGHYK